MDLMEQFRNAINAYSQEEETQEPINHDHSDYVDNHEDIFESGEVVINIESVGKIILN